MIVVTGTRRSGTSLWMQVFNAAGFSIIGEQFPRDWHETLRATNPHGFFESKLRDGINFHTNPDADSGLYLFAEASRRDVVKVFMPGLVRSERDYLDRVVATVRPWREYVRSLRRMYAIEDQLARSRGADPAAVIATRMPPALEWWDDNFAFINDLAVRKYPAHVQSFDGLLEDPRGVLGRVFAWLEAGELALDTFEAALACVRPSTRTQKRAAPDASEDAELLEGLPLQIGDVFDAYYAAVHRGEGLSALLVERMNEAHAQLAAQIFVARERTQTAARALQSPPTAFA